MFSVFITRHIPDKGLALLRARNDISFSIYPKDKKISRRELISHVRGAHAVLSLLTEKIDVEVFDAAGPQLTLVSNYAVGFDNIDLNEAKKRGVTITNTPSVLNDAVAEHTVALMFAVCRRIPEADTFVRKGKYKSWEPMLLLGTELKGKTLGIIGLGRIGSRVAEIARHGLAMRVMYHDIIPNAEFEKQTNATYASLETVLTESDVISLHVPLLESTRHLIGQAQLAMMKKTAYLVNTSRGPIIDEHALVAALTRKQIAGAGIDVFENEPVLTRGLTKLSNVVLTPHIASATIEARNEMSVLACQAIIDVADGKIPTNIVT